MKISSFFVGLALTTVPAMAQTPVGNIAPLPATTAATPQKMATVTPFITGLKEPQGMALGVPFVIGSKQQLEQQKEKPLDVQRTLLVCDYGSGEILQFDRDGKSLGALATGLKGPAQIVLGDSIRNYPSGSHIPAGSNRNPYTNLETVSFLYVTERKANRVISIDLQGKITPLGNEIPEPMGLVMGRGGLKVISHTTSKVYQLIPRSMPVLPYRPRPVPASGVDPEGKWELLYSAPSTDGARYGFRWLANDNGTYFLSDEVGECILMLTESGQVATFATGISDPSGIAIGPDKMVYVANEGDGGQLIRLNNEGEKTIIAEKLGRPRGILFLDAKTILVSNRDGNVWKIVLP